MHECECPLRVRHALYERGCVRSLSPHIYRPPRRPPAADRQDPPTDSRVFLCNLMLWSKLFVLKRL